MSKDSINILRRELQDVDGRVFPEVLSALNEAILALEKLSEIEDIITCPLPIQEDVLRYKAICGVVRR